jgi:putative acetyltransferase
MNAARSSLRRAAGYPVAPAQRTDEALTVILRRETSADRAAVFAVHTAAFARDDGMEAPEARLVDWLREDGDIIPALSLVATLDDAVVGHVLCSRASVDGRPSLGLGPLGVLPAHQRRGVGQALMHAVLAAADALDEPAVVLLGDPSYYRRFGFVLAEPLGILPPDPAWAPHFQVRRLSAWHEALRGTFRYAPAFDRL